MTIMILGQLLRRIKLRNYSDSDSASDSDIYLFDHTITNIYYVANCFIYIIKQLLVTEISEKTIRCC